MMIYGISINFKDSTYENITKILDGYELDEVTFLKNNDLKRYFKQREILTQEFAIEWKNFTDVDPSFIVDGAHGQFNKNAPKDAAQKVINYCDKVIVIGQGDSNINYLAKASNKEIVNGQQSKPKQYRF